MSSATTFKIMFNDHDYQLQLTNELCSYENFSGSLMELSTEILETPLYYFDSNNTKQAIANDSSFEAMILDSAGTQDNVIHLYGGNSAQGPTTATTSEWVFAPEEGTNDEDRRSTHPDSGTPFSDLYSTCFRQFGEVIDKHGRLIESNPHLRMLVSRFASSIAATPSTEMTPRLDEWLTSYNNNDNNASATRNDDKHSRKQHKRRHCGRGGHDSTQQCGGRHEMIASLPDDIAKFLLTNGPGRHHRHHHHHHRGHHQHPWMDHSYPAHPMHPDFASSIWGGGMHKHKHHHRHYHNEQPPHCSTLGGGPIGAFDPASTGPFGGHPLFDGKRHGKYSMMCSKSDRHFEKAMKHRHRRHPFFFEAPADFSSSSSSDSTTSSSSSSNSENEDTKVEQNEAQSKRQQKKLWKAIAKEQYHRGYFGRGGRGRHSHHEMHGPYGMHGNEGFSAHGRHHGPGFLFAGRPLRDGQAPHPHPPPPGYIEQSFGEMHLNDLKKH